MKKNLLILTVFTLFNQLIYAQDKTGDYWTMVALYLNPANSEAQSAFDAYRNENKGLPESVVKSGWEEFSEIYTPEQIFNAEGEVLPADQLPDVSDFIDTYDFVGKLGLGNATSGEDEDQRITKFELATFSLPSKSIKQLPTNIGNLTELITFTLKNHGGISILPESFATLTKLQTIDLKGNSFEYFPSQISRTTFSESTIKDPDNGMSGLNVLNLETQSPRMKNIPSAIFNSEGMYIKGAIYLSKNAFSYGELNKFLFLTEKSTRVRGIGAQELEEEVHFYGDISGGMTYTIPDRHHVEGTEYKWLSLPASATADGRSITISETGEYVCQTRNLELTRILSQDPDLTAGVNIPFTITIKSIASSTEVDLLLELSDANPGKFNWSTSIPLEDWEGVTFDEGNKVVALNLAGKGLTQLPDLSALTSLSALDITNNSLPFTEVLKIKALIDNPSTSVSYSKQNITLGVAKAINLELPAVLAVENKDVVAGNTYQWKKEENVIAEATNETLKIIDAGAYSLVISHTDLPELTFTSELITVTKVLSADETVLLTLANANDGKLNWSDALVVTKWEGVSVDDQNKVTAVNVAGKDLMQLTDLNLLADLTSLNVSDNKLNFEELRKVKTLMDDQNMTVKYLNQNIAVGEEKSEVVIFPYTINIVGLETLGGDTYQWFKNQEAIEGATASTYEASKEGVYEVEVSNASIANLSFTSEKITLSDKFKETKEILLALKTANSSDLNWDNALPLVQWEGIALENSEIRSLDVSGKELTKLTDLSLLTSLTSLNISNNKLSFGEILTVKDMIDAPEVTVNYTGQMIKVGEEKTVDLELPATISVEDIAVVGGNTYQWIKVEEAIEDETNETLSISEAGVYSLMISHSDLPDLSFTSEKITVTKVLSEDETVLLALANANSDQLDWRDEIVVTQWEGVVINDLNKVTAVDVSGKALLELTDLSNLSALASLNLSNNQFNFAEILKVKSFIDNANVTVDYTAQNITLGEAQTVSTQLPYTISINDISSLEGNSYQWYKDEAIIDGANSTTYDATEEGVFTVKVAHTDLPELSFTSAGVTVVDKVKPIQSVLLALSDANSGQLNWDAQTSISTWEGVTMSETADLIALDLQGKGLTQLTDLSELTTLVTIDISKNKLNFAEILKVKSFIDNANVTVDYTAQNISFGEEQTLPVQLPYTIMVADMASLGGNSYQWYKGSEKIEGARASTYEAIEEGVYTVKVMHSDLSDLSFTSLSVTVIDKVKPVKDALLVLSLANPGQLIWDAEKALSTWEGVTMNADNDLTALDLQGKGLTIMTDLTKLSALTSLDISNNELNFTEILKVKPLIDDTNIAVNYTSQNIVLGETESKEVKLPYTISVSDIDQLGGDTFQWYKGDEMIEGANATTYEVTEEGTYTITVNHSQIIDFEVTSAPITIKEDEVLAVDVLEALEVNVYPNPAQNYINLDLKQPVTALTISIFDVNGKLLLNTIYNNNAIDISSLPKGVNILKINYNGFSKSFKVIKN
ncbi:T9SS type A sorting domain-containing protein [Flammeovirga aprica]|uniref:T9SS type A sorting domain-containing protein n=1 Tax=Flammeovirga aprica JL-4 TaxID=694437 RepID=A0A7X9RVU5_9BACT|nr:T9SS type A sorting domain-containing protein [Flammeovirga aprica]NME69677.1 T9SS type A sorting domain-containing protein [Flammeovirga aprica JL-4]